MINFGKFDKLYPNNFLYADEPDQNREQNCAAMWGSKGYGGYWGGWFYSKYYPGELADFHWADINCYREHYFLCQKPSKFFRIPS